MTARDDLAVAALTRALVRTGMYVDAGIDTSAGLDKPQVYAAAILNDPDMAADGLHFVMVETLERQAAQTFPPAPDPAAGLREAPCSDEQLQAAFRKGVESVANARAARADYDSPGLDVERPENYAADRCVDCGELTVNRVHHEERLSAYHAARLKGDSDGG